MGSLLVVVVAVIAGAADIRMCRQWQIERGLERLLVEPMFQDGADAAVREGATRQGARRRGFQSCGRVSLGQAHQPQTRAIALLGMRLVLQDRVDESGGLRADRLGPPDEPGRCPLEMLLVGDGPVPRIGHVVPHARGADMTRDAVPLREDLDRRGGHAAIQFPLHQLIRHRIVVVQERDVVVDIGACLLPLGKLIPLCRQRTQSGPIKCLKQRAP